MIPVRSHHLKAMAQSPAHCRASMAGEERDPSAAMVRGTAVHALVFGTATVCTMPEGLKKPTSAQRNAKKPSPDSAKLIEAYDQFMADNQGACILNASDYETACRQAEAVRSSKEAEPYLQGIYERTIEWTFKGRAARCTPDIVANDGSWYADLKTARTADPKWFPYQARKLGYHLTGAYYSMAVNATHGTSPSGHLIVVESAPVYAVVVYRHNPHALALGEQWCHAQMERLLVCEQSGEWPSYAQSVLDLDVPDDDFNLDFGDETEGTEST